MSNGKHKLNKKTVFMILFVLLNIAVILWTGIDEFSGSSNAVGFRDLEVNWFMLLPAAGCWLAAILIETLKYCMLMRKTNGKSNFSLAIRTVLIGRYYDNITPSGIGGQPFQILFMNQNGIPASSASVVTIIAFLSMQFGFILLALYSFLVPYVQAELEFVRITRYVGLVFYAFFPIVILVFTFLPKLAARLLNWFVRVGYKLHLIKDCEKTEQSVISGISSYSDSIRSLKSSPLMCTVVMILGILYHAALCAIPYFVIRAFAGEMSFVACFVNTVSIYAAITFIPTPGNGGAAEGSFYIVFSILTAGYTFWAMITWRFFTYYIFIILGLFIYLEKHFKTRRLRKIQSQ